MEKYFISVIIPVYNGEKYIQRTIESVLCQTYQNYEIIIINDGSTDNTAKILNRYMNIPNIKIVSKQNEGQGIARNYGINIVEGEYIFFLDADDTIEKNTFEIMTKKIELLNVDTCIGNFKKVFQDGKTQEHKINIPEGVYEEEMIRKVIIKDLLCSNMKNGQETSLPVSVIKNLYSSKIIKENQLFFLSERQYFSEDLLFNLEYYKHSEKAYLMHKCLYNYYVYENSYSHTYQANYLQRARNLYDYLMENLENKDDDDIERISFRYLSYIIICLKQEKYNLSAERLNNIKKICNDSILEVAINNIKNRKDITIRKKVMYFLIKNKFYKLVNIIIEKLI